MLLWKSSTTHIWQYFLPQIASNRHTLHQASFSVIVHLQMHFLHLDLFILYMTKETRLRRFIYRDAYPLFATLYI